MMQRLRDALAWRRWYIESLLWRGVLCRIIHFPRVFESYASALMYCKAVLGIQRAFEVVPINVRGVGREPLWCRRATSDPWVLWDVCVHEFQQPPKLGRDPQTIVDLGANVGYTAVWYAAKYPQARVLAVEMDAGNFELAQRNVKRFGQRCEVVHAAVWNEDGEIEYGGGEEQGFRVCALNRVDTVSEHRRVSSRSLNSLFKEYALERVDYLTMDIEGAESVVLDGPLDWLDCVSCIKIEVHPPMTLVDCDARLTRAGFSVYRDTRHSHTMIGIRR